MNNELISVIMPAYNTEKYVSEAVESVIKQTYTNWELLAIDDGSTDNTGNILDNYAKTDSRIKVFHQKNKGVSAARNVGLDNAKGTWISFLDSDDLFTADALEKLYGKSDGFELVIGSYKTFGIEPMNHVFPTLQIKDKEELVLNINKVNLENIAGKLLRNTANLQRFDEECFSGEDGLFFISFTIKNTSIISLLDVVYLYRQEGLLTLSKKPLLLGRNVINKRIELYSRLFEEKGDLDSYHIHIVIGFLRRVLNKPNIDDAAKDAYIKELIEDQAFNKLDLKQYSITSTEMHIFSIIKTGDISLIKEVLCKN